MRNTTTSREVPGEGPVEVRRSARRRRSVSAFRERGRLVIAIPARFTADEEEEWVHRMVQRVRNKEKRRQPSDTELLERAVALAEKYLPAGVRPRSVRWVRNQNSRWGSCTPLDGSIRLSHRLQGMPAWVVDYVLVHELAHLVEFGHNAKFWAVVNQYPHTERARGFLDGVAYARSLPPSEE